MEMPPWTVRQLQSPPPPAAELCRSRGGHTVVPLSGFSRLSLVLLFGGADPFGVVTSAILLIDVDDGRTFAVESSPDDPATAPPAPRCSHAMFLEAVTPTQASVILYGGVSYLPELTVFGDLWRLTIRESDPGSFLGSWTCLHTTTPPGPRHSFACCVLPELHLAVVACGSDERNVARSDAYALTMTPEPQWHRLCRGDSPLPQCEMIAAAAVSNSSMLLVGGRRPDSDGSDYAPNAEAFLLSVALTDGVPSMMVRHLATGPEFCRVAHCAAGFPEFEMALLLGGHVPGGEPLASKDAVVAVQQSTSVKISECSRTACTNGNEGLFFGLGASSCRVDDRLLVISGLLPNEVDGSLALYELVNPGAALLHCETA